VNHRHAAVAITADPATTWLALTAGASEAHPLWGPAIHHLGLTVAMGLRTAIGLLIVAALHQATLRHPAITGRIWTPLTATFAVIACWNLGVAAISV
jgi:hypothetical protein